MKSDNHRREWEANWIWGGAEESPRNEWRCFRGSFVCPDKFSSGEEATLRIAADSRYEVFVNGKWVGRGPVRYFPADLFYDSYSIGHLLRRGERNSIAVLVIHYGISNFYYLRGRGGLLAQIDAVAVGGQTVIEATGNHWTTSLHSGQDPAVSRMSCQQGFAERIDGRLYQEDWMEAEFDDSGWDRSFVIGEAGMEPWTNLQPRDIPYLAEEFVQPVSVLSLNRVQPYRLTAFLDNYTLMKPQGEENANVICFAGAFGTMLRLKEAGDVKIILQASGIGIDGEVGGLLRIGDRLIKEAELEFESPLMRYQIALPAGEHLLLYTAFGPDHGVMQRIAVDCDKEIEWINPLTASSDIRALGDAPIRRIHHQGDDSPFVAIGPAFAYTMVDFEDGGMQNKRWRKEASLLAEAFERVSSLQSFMELGYSVHAVPRLLANGDDAFMPQVAKRKSDAYAVPLSLQQAAVSSPDPGIVPVFEDGDTEFMLDFGKEWSGYLHFELEAEEGVVIDWYGVEYRKGDYVQHTFGLDNTVRYIARNGRQRYVSPVRRGFRYLIVTVRGAKKPVLLHHVGVNQSNYPAPEVGQFHCSDARLNDIWDISRHTTRLCMEDTFVDCPAYEQVFWVGDSRNEALVNYYLFGGTDIVKRCLRLVPGSAFQTPLYGNQVPSGWRSVIPNWTFFWVAACAEYAEHTGDVEFAAEMLPPILFTLRHYIQHINSGGLLEINGWNLLDWAPIDQPNSGVVTHQNMLLVHALRQTAVMARLTGAEGDDWCLEQAERLEEAINGSLWSEERKAYLDCIHSDGKKSKNFSMQTQVIALLTGVANKEREGLLVSYLSDVPEGFVPIGSPFMSFFYYEVLMKYGRIRHMLDDMRANYGFMIDNGATTCWEMYGHTTMNRANENDLTRSHCHAWSAAPGYFLGANVLGVTPAAPGWSKIAIEPLAGDLDWAKGSVPIPGGGKIDVEWKAADGAIKTISVVAPEGVELDIVVPEQCKIDITRVKLIG